MLIIDTCPNLKKFADNKFNMTDRLKSVLTLSITRPGFYVTAEKVF